MKRKYLVLLAILAVMCWAAVASADTFAAFTLATPNTSLATSATPPPYAGVLVELNTAGTQATITFSTLQTFEVTGGNGGTAFTVSTLSTTAGGTTYTDYYSFIGTGLGAGANGGVAANVSGSFTNSGLQVGDTVGTFFATLPAGVAFVGSSTMDGFTTGAPAPGGQMSDAISLPNFGSGAPDIDVVQWIVTGSWANVNSVLTNDSKGFLAAAHLVADIAGSPGFPNGGSAITGFAGNGSNPPVPIPPTALLLGSGLLGLGLIGWRRKK